MDIYGKIAQKLKEIAGTGNARSIVFTAEVKSVEGNTCTVLLGDLEISDVRLKSVINTETDQIIIKPKVGSHVLIADTTGGQYRTLIVIEYSEPESITIKIGGTELLIDGTVIKFNNGSLGLVKVDKMVQWMQKVQSDLTTLQGLLSTYPVAGNGAPLGMAFTPTTPAPVASTFEDTKIKH